jgi:hypothetical protein
LHDCLWRPGEWQRGGKWADWVDPEKELGRRMVWERERKIRTLWRNVER